MLILSVNEENNKVNYKFTAADVEGCEGVVFNILVEYGIVKEGDESYFTCSYEELVHTKNNKKTEVNDSKIICDLFVNGIATDLLEKLEKIGEENSNGSK